jgi:hypothetical protein
MHRKVRRALQDFVGHPHGVRAASLAGTYFRQHHLVSRYRGRRSGRRDCLVENPCGIGEPALIHGLVGQSGHGKVARGSRQAGGAGERRRCIGGPAKRQLGHAHREEGLGVLLVHLEHRRRLLLGLFELARVHREHCDVVFAQHVHRINGGGLAADLEGALHVALLPMRHRQVRQPDAVRRKLLDQLFQLLARLVGFTDQQEIAAARAELLARRHAIDALDRLVVILLRFLAAPQVGHRRAESGIGAAQVGIELERFLVLRDRVLALARGLERLCLRVGPGCFQVRRGEGLVGGRAFFRHRRIAQLRSHLAGERTDGLEHLRLAGGLGLE